MAPLDAPDYMLEVVSTLIAPEVGAVTLTEKVDLRLGGVASRPIDEVASD